MFGLIIGALKVAALVLSVASAGVSICRNLGILKPDTEPEDLGDRALQAKEAGINPEDYDGRFEEYRDKIENFEIDPEKSNTYKTEQKIAAAGEVAGWALMDYYGKESGVDKFIEGEWNKNESYYEPARAAAYMEEFKGGGMDKIGDYFDNKLDSLQGIKQIEGKLQEAEKSLGVSEGEAKERLQAEVERRAEV